MIEPTSLLLGLEGLGVSAVVRRADCTRVVEVITTEHIVPGYGQAGNRHRCVDPYLALQAGCYEALD
jgi:hypothetical protein